MEKNWLSFVLNVVSSFILYVCININKKKLINVRIRLLMGLVIDISMLVSWGFLKKWWLMGIGCVYLKLVIRIKMVLKGLRCLMGLSVSFFCFFVVLLLNLYVI